MLRHLAFNVTYNPTNRNDEKERLDSSFVGIQQDLSKRGNRAAQHFYSLPSSGIDARREARGNTFAPISLEVFGLSIVYGYGYPPVDHVHLFWKHNDPKRPCSYWLDAIVTSCVRFKFWYKTQRSWCLSVLSYWFMINFERKLWRSLGFDIGFGCDARLACRNTIFLV